VCLVAITGIAIEKESAKNATEKLCPKLDFSLRWAWLFLEGRSRSLREAVAAICIAAQDLQPDVPVIMITAYRDPETKRKSRENGTHRSLQVRPAQGLTFCAARSAHKDRLARKDASPLAKSRHGGWAEKDTRWISGWDQVTSGRELIS
jgi:hypothetical protein